MTEELIRKIIQEELEKFFSKEKEISAKYNKTLIETVLRDIEYRAKLDGY